MYSHFVIAATLPTASNVVRVDPRDVLNRPMRGPDLVVRYDDHRDTVIDVFQPRGRGDEDPPSGPGPTPAPAVDSLGSSGASQPGTARVVVFLHGGFWRQEWDRTHVRPFAWALAAAGFVVATPEYRRGPGSWPSMSLDVHQAVGAVRGLVDKAMPGRVDRQAPLVLAGHSAGGHLALWSGLRAGPDVVERIVALAPVTDVGYAARTGMGDDAAQDLLGGEPDAEPAAYADADVVPRLPGRVPITMIQGDADVQVPVEMNRQIAERLSPAAGSATFRYVELPGVDHFALIDPESEAWPTVLRAFRQA
jgi:acetyl esterase/lipase